MGVATLLRLCELPSLRVLQAFINWETPVHSNVFEEFMNYEIQESQ